MLVGMSTWAPASVLLAALLTAWSANRNGFVWDDRSAVLGNLDAQNSPLSDVFAHDFWGTPLRSAHSHKSYRPLTVLSFRLNFHMAGGHSAWLYHFTNALVHAACALLVYCVACVLFQEHRNATRLQAAVKEKENPQDAAPPEQQVAEKTDSGGSMGPVTAGLLFAVHPIHCDAVASIVGRADLLCTALSLLAFLAYVKAASCCNRAWVYVALAMTLTIAAGLCKELGFTNFAVLVVYDVLRLHAHRRLDPTLWSMQLRLGCTVTVGVVAALVRVWINGEHRQMEWNMLANNIVVQESRLTRMLSYAHVHTWYLWKLVWPRWLSFDYGYNTIPVIDSVADPRNLYTLLAYMVVLAGLLTAAQQLHLVRGSTGNTHPTSLLMMSIAFGVVPFVPASNILLPVGTVVAERLLYFPSVGFCLLVGCAIDYTFSIASKYKNELVADAVGEGNENSESIDSRFSHKHAAVTFFTTARSMVTYCGSLLLVIACCRSHVRNAEWVSEEMLFKVATEVVPTNVKVLSNEAKTILNSNPEQALNYLRVSLGMVPKHIESNLNMGLAYLSLASDNVDNEDLFFNGVRHLYKSAMLAPNLFQAPGFLGSEIYKHWAKVSKNDETVVEDVLASETLVSATHFLDHAINQNSVFPTHFYHRAIIAFQIGDFDEAIRYFRMTEVANGIIRDRKVDLELLIEPALIYNMLGVCYCKKGQLDEALNLLRKGIILYPEETDLHVNAALTLNDLGHYNEAEAQLRAGLKAAKEPYHIPKLRKIAQLLENHRLVNAVQAFLDRAAALERKFSE